MPQLASGDMGREKSLSLQHKRSLAFGGLIGPLVVPLGMLPIMIIGELSTADPTGPHLAMIFVALLVFALPFTYAVTWVLVVPAAIWLRRRQALSAFGLCAWCALIDPVTANVYLRPLPVKSEASSLLPTSYGPASGWCQAPLSAWPPASR
ncbi:hypothetical protein [Shinella zoogloeoides]|uniref:hypothetical protein n=1 Tax=Shinella zoogloeoides TaxID=352475 RepID=UPI001F58614E|nr:hypothetical protein [Shinella zoogloeoides]